MRLSPLIRDVIVGKYLFQQKQGFCRKFGRSFYRNKIDQIARGYNLLSCKFKCVCTAEVFVTTVGSHVRNEITSGPKIRLRLFSYKLSP